MSVTGSILICDDDAAIRTVVTQALRRAGHRVTAAASLGDLKREMRGTMPDVVVTDVVLPDGNGLDVLKQWRTHKVSFPVLILTARGDWQDKVNGLKAGADDYLAKPFQTEELIARLHAIVRRSEGRIMDTLTAGRFELDENRQTLRAGDETEHSLTGTEFRLLRCLMSRPGQVFSKEQLLDQLYSIDDIPSENVIEAYVRRLRKLVGPDTIKTRRGQGYLFDADSR